MKAFITGKGLVSPIGNGKEILALPEISSSWLTAKKPEFTKYFEAKQARRTSKILKMGLVAAFDALGDNRKNLDGIIVGTGLGCIGDSEKFLLSLLQYDESMLSPTPFIQSTHNTIAGSIALQLKVHQYNFTYSERIFSFEWTLLDALMQLNETEKPSRFLVGAADELTNRTFHIANALGVYQAYDPAFSDIKNIKGSKVFAGEHAAFFTLSNQEEDQPCLHFVKMYFQQTIEDALKNIKSSLAKAKINNVDCILTGINGHKIYDQVYNKIEDGFPESNMAYFKHLSGESLSASSFGFWLATEILDGASIPKIVSLKQVKHKPIKNVLIINHLRKDYLSAIFISK